MSLLVSTWAGSVTRLRLIHQKTNFDMKSGDEGIGGESNPTSEEVWHAVQSSNNPD